MPAGFGMSAEGADALDGYVGGIVKTVSTDAYLSSAVAFSHAVLADAFDLWMDGVAKTNPEEYSHVYEWPHVWHDYEETVGDPSSRLWAHVLIGNGRIKTASFTFLPSVRPSPVDPILLQSGDDGQHVKEGVHIFEFKATAMEYAVDITVTPKLANYLAYVGNRGDQGEDPGWHHAKDNEEGSVNFSEGPVSFIAGGGVHNLKFTTQFLVFWKTMADKVFADRVQPRLAGDLIDERELAALIRRGNAKSMKTVKMRAQASGKSATFSGAQTAAIREMKQNERDYISEAAVRRYDNYGV